MLAPRLIRVLTLLLAATATAGARADFRLEIKPLMNGATGRERSGEKLISTGNSGSTLALANIASDSLAGLAHNESFAGYAANMLKNINISSHDGAGSFKLPAHASLIAALATEYAHSNKDSHGKTPDQIDLWQDVVNDFAHDHKSHHGHWDPNDSGSDHSHRGGGRFGPGSHGGDDGNGILQHAPAPASALLAAIGMCTVVGARLRRCFSGHRA